MNKSEVTMKIIRIEKLQNKKSVEKIAIMKLTENQVKQIIIKVHKDLNLTHSDKYPIYCNYDYATCY